MNERDMQFRIGIFVIMAGLVLTMLIIWFGESPTFLQNRVYLVVRFHEAPGVAEGVPVRKNGIRIGEVASIRFDDRPGQPEGVLVTLSLDAQYKLRQGTVPRISRALIGDVAVDMLPGTGTEPLAVSSNPSSAPVIEGTVSPDPSSLLSSASEAFERVGETLTAIDRAAKAIADITERADELESFLATWSDTGKKVGDLADDVKQFIAANEGDFKPALTNLREVAEKVNRTLDPDTQAKIQATIDRLSTASSKLDEGITKLQPLLTDLGADSNQVPTTNFGQSLYRINRVAYDVSLLTKSLNNGQGGLNESGSLQRLVTRAELYDNVSQMVTTARAAFTDARSVLGDLRQFSQKIARDPSVITRGALSR